MNFKDVESEFDRDFLKGRQKNFLKFSFFLTSVFVGIGLFFWFADGLQARVFEVLN